MQRPTTSVVPDAYVVTVPLLAKSNFLIQLLFLSATYKYPDESALIPVGPLNVEPKKSVFEEPDVFDTPTKIVSPPPLGSHFP